MTEPFWPTALAAALLSATGVGIYLRYSLRVGLLDLPGDRASHVVPTPTGGGVGILAALAVLAVWPPLLHFWPLAWLSVILPGMLLLGVVGWIDDRRGLGWRSRLVVQVLVSLALLAFLASFEGESAWTGTVLMDGFARESAQGAFAWIGVLVALLFLVGTMNAFNFMDGSNGMAGAQAVLAGAFLAWLFVSAGEGGWALASGALAGAALGFLPWNVPRARLFMGDAGSVPLGFALASLMLLAAYGGSAPGPLALLALGPFFVDSSLTLLRRLIRGERWYTAHRQHLYQRLIGRGWGHVGVMALYLAVNVLVLGPVLAGYVEGPAQAWRYTGTVFALMGAAWLLASRILGEQDEP